MSKVNYAKIGDAAFGRMEKMNSELLALMYGTLVSQLIKDFEDIESVNEELEQMGYRIGVRLIEEFIGKSGISNCNNFRETVEVIAKVGFKMFLGVSADIREINDDKSNNENIKYSIILNRNPLIDFVEIPLVLNDLIYSNILCGVLRGGLEQLQMKVKCYIMKDSLKGFEFDEIGIELLQVLKDEFPDDNI